MRTITLEEHFATPGFLDGPLKGLRTPATPPAPPSSSNSSAISATGASPDGLSRHRRAGGLAHRPRRRADGSRRRGRDGARHQRLPRRRHEAASDPHRRLRRAADGRRPTRRRRNWSGASASRNSPARSSTATTAAAISTTNSTGRSWNARKSSASPIYLHPTRPPQPVIEASFGGFSPLVTELFSGPGWGWHIETGVHVLRMVLGGVFDRFPDLQIVIGHLGEGLAAMFQRVDIMAPAVDQAEKPGRRLSAPQRPLHLLGLQFHPDLPGSAARGRRRPHHVLGRPSLPVDGARPRIPRPAPGQPGGQGTHRARQRGEAVPLVGYAAFASS